MFDGPIKCTLLEAGLMEPKPWTHREFQLEHLDGKPLTEEELIDIGQTPWGHKWPDDIETFLWKIKNYTPDIANRYWQMRTFAAAFRTIGFIIPRKYRFQRNADGPAHFNIEFTSDMDVFQNRSTVIAQAYLVHPRNPPGFNGLIQYNDNQFFTPFGDDLPAYLVDSIHYTEGETWNDGRLKMLGTQPLLEVDMHEIKHSHGYRHDTNSPESLMYPFVKPGYNADGTINRGAFIWTEDDMLRWEEGYGRRSFAWLRHMRARRLRGRFVPGIPYRVAT